MFVSEKVLASVIVLKVSRMALGFALLPLLS